MRGRVLAWVVVVVVVTLVNAAPPLNKPTPGGRSDAASLSATMVVGSRPADPLELPGITAGIMKRNDKLCTGTLIRLRFLVTAAHCVQPYDPRDIRVRIQNYLRVGRSSPFSYTDFTVASVKIHEGYEEENYHNDIAIVTLEQPMDFPEDVWPVSLPTGDESYDGRDGTVIGRGTINSDGSVSPNLIEATVPVWTNAECRAAYPNRVITDDQFCAGERERGKDPCQGNIGDPFLVRRPNGKGWTLVGVMSYGLLCADSRFPVAIYTRVNQILPWITQNTV